MEAKLESKGVMMNSVGDSYFRLLSDGKLTTSTIDRITAFMENKGMLMNPIPEDSDILKRNEFGGRITKWLTRLELYTVGGNRSWEGLLVGFPGTKDELSTKSVGTPYLRMILYPILDLHHRLQNELGKKLPCIYFVGNRFSDVFLRKFVLLKKVVPHIIVLTHDICECSKNKIRPPKTNKTEEHESWTQMRLCKHMYADGLVIPTETMNITIEFISYEVPCSEGTENPERLDILGYDESDHSLVAFELKGVEGSKDRVALENLFLQGLEHRNWLEKNKMAIKLLFDEGPNGKRINTRKRVRLLLGFYGNKVPHLFEELREQETRRDKYAHIDFVRLINDKGNVVVSKF